jgi:dihydropteroate synthase
MAGKPPVLLPGGEILDFSGPALVMAIVNCNEDSFYAPSRVLREKALEKALAAEEEEASIIDFGGESTRPGASYIGVEEEFERVIPVIQAFRKHSALPVSVDTRKVEVARVALEAGADIINDISALGDDPGMAGACAGFGAAVVLMHRKGDPAGYPATMWRRTSPGHPGEALLYEDAVAEIGAYLRAAAERAIDAGISKERIILDPGFGFGKNPGDDLEILRRLPRLAEICGKDYPLLAGLSRKRFIGAITGREAAERLSGTLAANCAAIMGGADIIRVHDVKEHVDLVKMLFALRRSDSG